jgi:RNA-directed DNA polymerase
VGVDGQTAEAYAESLEENLEDLLNRFRSGRYRAPAVRRVHIPKGDGRKTRPIGIPTFEDKVLQRSVAMVLEAVYEQDFLNCSYGFRPGRSAHMALEALWKGTMDLNGGWVLELDIESFFDTVDHDHLRSFLDQRVRDGVIRRTIGKWLKAGVLEAGVMQRNAAGTPQGGVISPLLANIYLHHVLDVWFAEVVQPRLGGRAFLVRYADDAVLVFEHASDAERVMRVIAERFGKFGLRLHPDKTRLIEFRRPRSAVDLPPEVPGFRCWVSRTTGGRLERGGPPSNARRQPRA